MIAFTASFTKFLLWISLFLHDSEVSCGHGVGKRQTPLPLPYLESTGYPIVLPEGMQIFWIMIFQPVCLFLSFPVLVPRQF